MRPMPKTDFTDLPKGIQRSRALPDPTLGALWESIILDETIKRALARQNAVAPGGTDVGPRRIPRNTEKMNTWDVLHKYPHDYKVVIVGDATMSPYEITYPGGSVEHWNEEPGAVWLERLTRIYEHAIWLNPVPNATGNTRPRSKS